MTTNGIDACKHVLVLADNYRQHAGRVIATLARYSGDIDLAEDAFQDAIEVALDRWPTNGEPDSPAAWLTTVARRKMIDRLRRDERGREKTELLASDATLASPTPSPTTASSWSSPVVIPRSRPRRGLPSRCGPSAVSRLPKSRTRSLFPKRRWLNASSARNERSQQPESPSRFQPIASSPIRSTRCSELCISCSTRVIRRVKATR